MVKTYSLKADGNKRCSAHTRVKEMRCKDGTDKILVDENLMTMIEKLFSTLKCSKYIITSGYRTPTHDKAVGGNGYGQHTTGRAVDCKFYDKKGKVISSQEISCIAQDLGFKGIANITSRYQEIHLDMRTKGIYKGNEIYGTKSVTDDFYSYYGIDRNALRKKYGLSVEEKAAVTYQVWNNKQNKWLQNVKSDDDYAGIFGNDICCIYANLSKGNIFYRVHTVGGSWLPEVKNRTDYAGIYKKPIDAVMFKTDGGSAIKYRVHLRRQNKWLPWVSGYNSLDSSNGFAGVFGQEIDAIQIKI